jgi:hypothetical protein
LPIVGTCAHYFGWGTKSRESIYGSTIRQSAERAKEAPREADRLACIAWNQRMLGFQGPAQPSRALADALNAVADETARPLLHEIITTGRIDRLEGNPFDCAAGQVVLSEQGRKR